MAMPVNDVQENENPKRRKKFDCEVISQNLYFFIMDIITITQTQRNRKRQLSKSESL